MRRRPPTALLLLVALAACRGRHPAPPAGESPPPPPAAADPFRDVTDAAGLRFTHDNGASPRRLLPETLGSGVAAFDYDGDGLPDLYFADARPFAGGGTATGALYRNLGGGRFADVTAGSGLDRSFFAMGTAVADVDGDGDLDLFVSAVGGDRLFVNLGDGRFADATAAAGVGDRGFGSSAAFLDFDRDGRPDLFVGRYVRWSPAADVACSPDRVHRTYCTPEVYEGEPSLLYRNRGAGRFAEVGRRAGIAVPGKTLGVAVLDADGDGWPDLAVANDTVRNFLFRNRHDGTFTEQGVASGFAYSESGATRGGMGIAAGDLTGNGLADLVVGNFSQEMSAFYRASRAGLYRDDAAQAGLGLPTLMSLAFGTLVFDVDGDGDLDVLLANGHIEPEIAQTQPLQTYAQRPQLFLNEGGGRFREVEGRGGSPLDTPYVGRGLATLDADGDGDLDVVLTQNGRPARLFENTSPPRSWLRLALVGRGGDPAVFGTVVTAVAGSRRWVRTLTSGGSYLSASEPLLNLGLGGVDRLDRLEIAWPSGTVQILAEPPLDTRLTVVEPAPPAAGRPPAGGSMRTLLN